jgi:hypothetical protein
MLMDRLSSREKLEGILFPKKDKFGRTIYFPNGAWGNGYVVATEDQKERILRGYIRTCDVLIVGIIVAAFVSVFLELPTIAIASTVFLASIMLFPLSARLHVRGLQKAEPTLTLREAHLIFTRFTDWDKLVYAEIFLAFLFVRQVLNLAPNRPWWQIIVVTALGLCIGIFGYFIYLKWRNRE